MMANPGKRSFLPLQPVIVCYELPDEAKVDHNLYDRLSSSGSQNIVKKLTVPKCEGLAWEVKAGQTVRFVVAYGSQVGDLNVWNLHDPSEHFYAGKTRQLHRSHLSTYDRLWSNMPHLRPLATVSADSLSDYGIDADGCGIHDVIGTRCDPYTRRVVGGTSGKGRSCHGNLVEAIKPWGLGESAVHDVFNIFMVTGFSKDTHQYVMRGCPAKVGDYIELLAEVDLLMALSACPHGDVSTPVGDGHTVPEDTCHPLDVLIGQPSEALLEEWRQGKGQKGEK